jgi:hypothetical protein
MDCKVRKLFLLLLFLLVPSLGWAQSWTPVSLGPGINIANLPAASRTTGQAWLIKDGASATDCVTGLGTNTVWCLSNGTTYSNLTAGTGASAGVPSGGSTTTLLHGPGSAPTWSAASLTADVTGILPGANGGTGNGFFAVTGPTTSLRTFTFPDASTTVLTTNATVTAAQGGTGQGSYAVGDILYADTTTTLAKLPDVAVNQVFTSGGVGVAPTWSATPTLTGLTIGTSNLAMGLNAITFASAQSLIADAANTTWIRNGTTSQTLYVTNTYTNASNFESGGFQWSSNILNIGTFTTGGSVRNIAFQTGGGGTFTLSRQSTVNGLVHRVQMNANLTAASESGYGFITPSMTSTNTNQAIATFAATFAPASGTPTNYGLVVNPTINWGGTPGAGSYEALNIKVVETALPTGTNYLIRALAGSAGTTEKFSVDNTGTIKTGIWNGTAVTVAFGGTGDTTLTSNGVLYGNGTGVVLATAQGGANTVLIANSGAPSFSSSPIIGTSLRVVDTTALSTGNILQVKGHIANTGTAPTVSSGCGTTPGTPLGTDNGFSVVLGSGTPTSCLINFAATWASAPVCICSDVTRTLATSSGTSTTQVNCNGVFVAGDTLTWICMGRS